MRLGITKIQSMGEISGSQGGEYEVQESLIALILEEARTSETSVHVYLTTRQYIPEDSEPQSMGDQKSISTDDKREEFTHISQQVFLLSVHKGLEFPSPNPTASVQMSYIVSLL
jgi:hypothetical protein